MNTRNLTVQKGTVFSEDISICYHCSENVDLPPIVLVHGWGSSFQGNWLDTGWVATLAGIRQVIGLDIRGHGDSDKPHDQARYRYAAMSGDVLRVMDQLEIEKADFMGYSMGACIGAVLMSQNSHRFDRLILGGIGDETDASLAMLPRILAGLRASNQSEIKDPVGLGYRQFAESDPRNDLQSLALSAAQIWPEGFPNQLAGQGITDIDNRILIVNGENDEPYVNTVDSFAQALTNVEIEVIPRRDHLSLVTDQQFKDRVTGFLSS